MDSIPENWVRRYIDQLLELAKSLPEGPMRQMTLLRAEYVMDMVKAWRVNGQS